MTRTGAEWATWASEHPTFNLLPRGGSMAAVTAEGRERMNQVEKRLLAFGVKQGRA